MLSKYILEMLLVSKVEQSSSAQVHRALQVVVISVLLLDVEATVVFVAVDAPSGPLWCRRERLAHKVLPRAAMRVMIAVLYLCLPFDCFDESKRKRKSMGVRVQNFADDERRYNAERRARSRGSHFHGLFLRGKETKEVKSRKAGSLDFGVFLETLQLKGTASAAFRVGLLSHKGATFGRGK